MKKKEKVQSSRKFISKMFHFFGLAIKDMWTFKGERGFQQYGLTIFTGMQGYGKTMSMVEKLEEIRINYPDVIICTNFGYVHQDVALTDWKQILEIRNEAGVVFGIDEIQNEFDVYKTQSFNMKILRTITQQRKQSIKIFATSQHFNRVSKPLREQTFEVVECYTIGGRWTFEKCFLAEEFSAVIDNPERKAKLKRKWRKNFIQTDNLRSLYDSYAVIDTMLQLENQQREFEKKNPNFRVAQG